MLKRLAAPSILEEWNGYRKRCVAPEADAIQVTETKRAFYAGASVMLTMVFQLVAQADKMTDDEGSAALATLTHELEAFARYPL